jgi:hypothetical protein
MFDRKPKRVYVLGAGPAGLLAAHAAQKRGYEVTVFSRPNDQGYAAKSELHGCQYLHRSIPDLTFSVDGRPVSYKLAGSMEAYRRKVYGDGWEGRVSPDEFGPEGAHYAWDLRAAYDTLWRRFLPQIVPTLLTAESVRVFTEDPHAHTFVSIPAPSLCRRIEEHKFPTQDVWAMGSAPGNYLPYEAPDFTVECNGEPAPRWYRAATVFGHSTLEWPGGVKPPIRGVAAVRKPLSTDCDCHLGKRVTRIGRYGRWTKGVLSHTAYFEAAEALG